MATLIRKRMEKLRASGSTFLQELNPLRAPAGGLKAPLLVLTLLVTETWPHHQRGRAWVFLPSSVG